MLTPADLLLVHRHYDWHGTQVSLVRSFPTRVTIRLMDGQIVDLDKNAFAEEATLINEESVISRETVVD